MIKLKVSTVNQSINYLLIKENTKIPKFNNLTI